MLSKYILTFLIIGILSSCSCNNDESPQPAKNMNAHPESIDSLVVEDSVKLDGLEIFIESMINDNYLIEPSRIKQTMWSVLGDYPTSEFNGRKVLEVPFPVEQYQEHLSNPKSYFFAHWNEEKQTFKNETDYLLMTWNIDSVGIDKEEDIYGALHDFMGNFPSYVFRSKNEVYAMCHRQTVMASKTLELTEKLRTYIDSTAKIHRPFGGFIPR